MTREEYFANLKEIGQKNPTHPLYPELQKGYDTLRVMYMKSAMRNIAAIAPPSPALSVEQEPQGSTGFADETLRGLWKQRKDLYAEMNKMSNHFHDCKTDDERASNSSLILGIWEKIMEVKSMIAHYEKWAQLPEENNQAFVLPEDPVGLVKKLNSIRVQISQTKKKLDDLALLDVNDPNRAAIKDAEARLNHLKLYAGHAETAIAAKSIYP